MTARVRKLSIEALETPTRRLKLGKRVKPYWHKIATGIAIGYRAGPGTWVVRCADGKGGNWVRKIGGADDRETANGSTVFTYSQALDRARVLGRGGDEGDPHAGKRPVTVREAIEDYRADLIARRQMSNNADQPLRHLTPALLAKPVTLLTARELKVWRNGMRTSGEKASSINRRCSALKAALNLAAREDARITNITAWTFSLSKLPEDEAEEIGEGNVLDDKQRAAMIREAYAIGEGFGVYVELHDATGMRSSQIRLIKVRDLRHSKEGWMLDVPSSLKGKGRTARNMIPLPISASLAARLKAFVAGKKPTDLLMGYEWIENQRRPMRRIAEAVGLDADVITFYAFRHTAITRALLRNLPIRLVAASFDTSVTMIEKTYSRFIVHKGNDQLRAALVSDAVSSGNVIALRG